MTSPQWTPEQVEALNRYQSSGKMHPFTCGNSTCRRTNSDVLLATPEGWKCEHCDYTQDWAHGFMLTF